MKSNQIPKFLKGVISSAATVLSLVNDDIIRYLCIIANNFNKYFACIEALLISLPVSVWLRDESEPHHFPRAFYSCTPNV